jgi:hypothetical protein
MKNHRVARPVFAIEDPRYPIVKSIKSQNELEALDQSSQEASLLQGRHRKKRSRSTQHPQPVPPMWVSGMLQQNRRQPYNVPYQRRQSQRLMEGLVRGIHDGGNQRLFDLWRLLFCPIDGTVTQSLTQNGLRKRSKENDQVMLPCMKTCG